MANLNFQQAPRNISNQGLNRGGFNTNSLSGHVTPTSGMFPGSSGINNSFTPQPLSPSRNIPPMANRGLFGQRAFADRRSIPGLGNSNPMGSMGSFGIPQSRSYGSQGTINNFHSVFSGSGTSGDTATPPLLDLSEFPSLTNRGQAESMPQPSPMPGKQPYGRPIRAVPNLTKPCPSEPNITLTSKSQEGASSSRQLKSQGKHNRADPNPTKPCPSEPTITFKPKSIAVSNPARPRAVVKSSVGMVKQPTAESSEFTMSSEDFPALPGTQRMDVPSPGGSVSAEKNIPGIGGSDMNQDSSGNNRSSNFDKAVKRGIQTSPDGKVTRIPASMVKDQFGMVGLLTFIRAAETDPNLVSLALGQDLTALGLNLNSPENLYPNFGGPWAETPCRPQDIDFHVPPEYLINPSIRDKLGPVKLNRYKDDLLFYMFYTNVGDVAQLAAATELYNREWRYHTEEKVWISQAPGMGIVEKTPTWERGTYYYFDAQNWRKAAKEFHLDYSKLEGRPQMPAAMNQSQNII